MVNHPLRPIKLQVDRILVSMDEVSTVRMPVREGRVPLWSGHSKRSCFRAIDSIRSELQIVQRIDTDWLFRWFLGMNPK